MADVVAEERTTLPEGATLSLSRIQRPKLGACNELRAWMGDKIIKMRTDDIAPQNLRWYLDQVVKHINRERVKLTKKPSMLFQSPKTIPDFVNNMAFSGMFILDAAIAPPATNFGAEPKKAKPIETFTGDTDGNVFKKQPDKPKKRRRKAKKEVAVTIPANGSKPI